MQGTNAGSDPLAGVLASRNAGDKTDLAAYARHLINAGCEVVLVDPNGKTPIDFRTAAMKRADIKSGAPTRGDGTAKEGWYSGTTSAARAKTLIERAAEQGITPNVGIHIGGSNYILLDMDNAGDVAAAEKLWAEHGDTLPLITVRTPGQVGGDGRVEHDGKAGHVWLRLPEGVDPAGLRPYAERLSKAEQEAQGRGGFVVMAGVGKGALLPPSGRPEGPYAYLDSLIVEAPAWLIELLTKPEHTAGASGEDTRSASVAAWEDSTPWSDILPHYGFTPTGQFDSCGCPTWTRPGKSSGRSAVAHKPGCGELAESRKIGPLHLYTDAGPAELNGELTWSKLAFIAAMEQVSIPEMKRRLGIAEPPPEMPDLLSGVNLGPRTTSYRDRPGLHAVPDDATDETSDEPDEPEEPEERNPFGVPPLHPNQLPEIEGAIPGGFWNASPVLQWIAADAVEQGVSAWGLLGTVLVHLSTHVPHHVVLPTAAGTTPSTLGEGGSLNVATVLVGESGTGKSQILKHAMAVLPPDCLVVGAGTGQGWVSKFVHTETDTDQTTKAKTKIRVRDRYALMLSCPEIDGFMADFYRTGSKTGSVMRELLSGDATSNITADREREAYLKAGSYRFSGVVGAQPSHLAAMFTATEIQGGTPQRFLLMPVSADLQPRAPKPVSLEVAPPLFPSAGPPNLLGLADGDDEPLPPPHVVPWAPAAAQFMAQLRAERDALAQRGFVPTLGMSPEEREQHTARSIQNHTALTRLRVAALLSFLHGRAAPTDEDWALSGVVIRIHLGMLSAVWEELRESGDAEAWEAGRQYGVKLAAADSSRNGIHSETRSRAARTLLRALQKHGPQAGGDLRKRLASEQRPYFNHAVDDLLSSGQVRRDGQKFYAVKTA